MTITVIRPGSDNLQGGAITFNGGPTSAWDCLNDSPVDDNSYISCADGAKYPAANMRVFPVFGSLSGVTTNQRILRIRMRVRIRLNTSSGGINGSLSLLERTGPGQWDFSEWFGYSGTTTVEYPGVWRNHPPSTLGSEWTAYSVEHCEADIRFWPSASGGARNLRLSELYWDVDVRDRPVVSGVTVAGSTSTTSPTISWTYTPNADNDPQIAWRVKVFSSAQYTATGFNPETSPSAWDSGEKVGNAASVTVATSLVNGATYQAYVKGAQDFNGSRWYSGWASASAFTINLNPLPVPTMLSVASDNTVPFLRNRINVQANWNQLSLQDSTLEAAGIGTWAALFGGATLARSTSQAAHGVASLAMTKVSTGDMEALTAGGVTGVKVKGGQSYTALASFRAAATARTVQVGIGWTDRTGTAISNAYGTGVTDTTSGWTQASYTFTAPSNAVYGAVWVKVTAPATSEVHYIDKVMLGTNVVIGTSGGGGSSGTTTPVVAAKYDSGYWASPSKAITCNGVPDGSLFVVTTAAGVTASGTTVSVSSSPSLTWTSRRENNTASTGDASIHTAYAATGGNYTVTVASSNMADARSIVYAITGHDEVSFGGAVNGASSTSGAPSVSLTTTRENSLVIGVNGDYNEVNGNSRVYRVPGGSITEDFYGDFGNGVVYHWHSTRATIGAGTEGLTAPTGQSYGISVIEIRGATGSSSSTTATGWSQGGYAGTASTVVERALISTGPRNNAHPQLWSGGDWLRTADGFYLLGPESTVTYDNTERFDGEGCIRWGVNNLGAKLYFGWPSGPVDDSTPDWVLPGVVGTVYTFSVYAKAAASFSSQLNLQALDQYGVPVGSPTNNGGMTISTSWTKYSATITMPAGAVYVRPHLDNTASATEKLVYVDGAQWMQGSVTDTLPGDGTGQGVIWTTVRNADQSELLISDGSTALVQAVMDNEAPPGYLVMYRAYNYVAPTDTSAALSSQATLYATAQLAPPGAGVWLLRDPQDATLALRIHVVAMSEEQHEEASTVYPLRPTTFDQLGQRAVTVSDFIGGQDGSLTVWCDTESEWLLLERLVGKPSVLWLTFPEFGARYIRVTGRTWSRDSARTGQVTSDSVWRRALTLTFLEADAP